MSSNSHKAYRNGHFHVHTQDYRGKAESWAEIATTQNDCDFCQSISQDGVSKTTIGETDHCITTIWQTIFTKSRYLPLKSHIAQYSCKQLWQLPLTIHDMHLQDHAVLICSTAECTPQECPFCKNKKIRFIALWLSVGNRLGKMPRRIQCMIQSCSTNILTRSNMYHLPNWKMDQFVCPTCLLTHAVRIFDLTGSDWTFRMTCLDSWSGTLKENEALNLDLRMWSSLSLLLIDAMTIRLPREGYKCRSTVLRIPISCSDLAFLSEEVS